MHVTSFDNAGRFSDHVTPMLLRREAENNLVLGLVSQLVAGTQPAESLMCSIDDRNGQPVAAAVMTPTHPLVLTGAPAEAAPLLTVHLQNMRLAPPAASGPDETVAAFADCWCAATGVKQRLGSMLGGFVLTKVIPPSRPAPGHFREAMSDDVELLVTWANDFFVETDHVGIDDPREVVSTRIKEGRLFVWCDDGDRPVCMGGWAGKTPNGVRVNFVYTPPHNRRRGHASACVAALSQALLDGGAKFCFLYTNLASPTPNKIYQQMGYRHIGNFRDVRFESPDPSGDS